LASLSSHPSSLRPFLLSPLSFPLLLLLNLDFVLLGFVDVLLDGSADLLVVFEFLVVLDDN
jgi:hypothetical protein